MSLRYEQYSSLSRTKKFLIDVSLMQTKSKKLEKLKKEASSCLKHFPALSNTGIPIWSNDNFTNEEGDPTF
jgi:hypothetical protein